MQNHTSLASYYGGLPRPWVAMRTWSAWARVDLEGLGASYDELELKHLLARPLHRAPPHYSREKYIMNASSGVHIINVHGVYQTPTGLGFPGQPLANNSPPGTPWPEQQLLMDPSLAYHFHFTNVGRDRGRASKIPADEVRDSRVQEIARAQLETPRGRQLKARAEAVEAWRKANPDRVVQRKRPTMPEGTVCLNCGR
jgi:hypothetical protein